MKNTDNVGLLHTHCAEQRKQEWQLNNPNVALQLGYYCKIEFKEGEHTEHMWVVVLVVDNEKGEYSAKLDNDPIGLTNIKCGDTVSFKYKDIEDLIKDLK